MSTPYINGALTLASRISGPYRSYNIFVINKFMSNPVPACDKDGTFKITIGHK